MGKVIYLYKGGNNMKREISVFDVASTFLTYGEMTHKKLQKLCYYAQAWNLALYKSRLFNSGFEAWVHGPVCKELYEQYKGFGWNAIPLTKERPTNIDEPTLDMIDVVYETYGDFSGDELEMLTHAEEPWKKARLGLEEWEPSNNIIDETIMGNYYSKIYEQAQYN